MNPLTSGILLVDKPAGLTSHDVCFRIKRLTGIKKVGHTGTLDPMATGLMVVLLDKATRLNQFAGGEKKTYEASMLFGARYDTLDTTGTFLCEKPSAFTSAELAGALEALKGPSLQLPPLYSAKKVGGKKLYEYARGQVQVERTPVPIEVYEALLLAHDVPKSARVRFCVSKGTYIRSLIDDLGSSLGTYAAMSALRRTFAEPFSLEDAHTLEQLEEQDWHSFLLPMDRALVGYEKVVVHPQSERFVLGGNLLQKKNLLSLSPRLRVGELCRIYCEDRFLAMGTLAAAGEEPLVKPNKIFV